MIFSAPGLRFAPVCDFCSGAPRCSLRAIASPSRKNLAGSRSLSTGRGKISRHPLGFTLIEAILVIVILGVFAALAAIEYAPVTRVRVRAAADKLKADMQYAQSLALQTRNKCGVTFSGNTYTVFENNNTADPAQDPLTKQNYTVAFNTGEYQGVTITSATFGSTSTLKFDREGIPYDGSDNVLPSGAASRQVILNSATNIIVTQTTGKVLIQ